jgi:CheY-like chemotaxis protein
MNERLPYILMLDDDSDDRYLTAMLFKEQEYPVDLKFVTNTVDVLPFMNRCIKEYQQLPSLIILDKNVPSGNGFEVLKELKSNSAFQNIPVVMISGSSNPMEIEECYRLGASSYIVKPMSNELTHKKIDAFVRYWFETVELPQRKAPAAFFE